MLRAGRLLIYASHRMAPRILLLLATKSYRSISLVCQLRGCHSFRYGELILATDQKGRKYLFELKEKGELHLSSGKVLHSTISTGCPGQVFKTHLGTSGLVVRRPSLEEYTVLMSRGPTPTYPKDVLAMIGMMDVNPGSQVVEAGSGSGAMTLHLSRAVGIGGKVLSFEVKELHLQCAIRNHQRWLRSWQAHRANSWPENVHFIHDDLANVCKYVNKEEIDAVALDVLDPTAVILQVTQVLKPSGVVVAYLPNITQVVRLVEHIETVSVLHCEGVFEVNYREWTVMPAWRKHAHKTDTSIVPNCKGPQPTPKTEENTKPKKDCFLGSTFEEISGQVEDSGPEISFGLKESSQIPSSKVPHDTNSGPSSIPTHHFIARPSHHQQPHTAFLVHLRKVLR